LRNPVNTASTPLLIALRACRKHFIYAALFSALLNILFLAPTLYMLQVYDRVVPTQGITTLAFLTVVTLMALGVLALLDMVRSRLLVRAGLRLDRLLAAQVIEATLARPGQAQQNMTRQALREFDTFRQTITGAGILALFDAPWTPIYIIVCTMIHPLLGLVALTGGGLLLLLAWRNEVTTRDPIREATQAANAAYLSQEHTTASSDILRALGMRRAMVRMHMRERETATVLQTRASFSGGGYVTLTRFVRLSLQSLSLGLGALLAIQNQISPGAIFAASFLVARAMAPLEQVLGAWRGVIQARTAYEALNELFERTPAEVGATYLPAPEGRVEAEHLVVFNEARDGAILADVSFKCGPAEAVGVVGPSGAGKSTLARVLAGAALPDRGAVRFDGADVQDWDSEVLAAHIGFLPQDPTLFAGTIKDNIARFRTSGGENDDAVSAAAVRAAQLCGAHDMILRLPDGYETMLAWGGKGLSAGQAQRVALARALYGDPKIIILDEPNAHLDAEGEAALVRTINTLKANGATILIVVHRTGILGAVDKLIILRDGRLERFGPRDDVVKQLVQHAKSPDAVAHKEEEADA